MRADSFDSAEWGEIVARFGGEAGLAASAREHGAFARRREVRSASDLLRLAFMYGPGGLSLRSLAASASADGVCEASDVALLKRLSGASGWLSALCADVLASGREAGETGVPTPRRGQSASSTPAGSKVRAVGPFACIWLLIQRPAG